MGQGGTCAWFHLTVDLPRDASALTDLALVIDLDGEALARADDGSIVGMVTSRLTPVERHAPTRAKTLLRVDSLGPAVRDGRVSLWLDAGFNGKLAPP